MGGLSGIDFNNTVPDTFSVNNVTPLDITNASICDDLGNLLFYTNGVSIFKRNSDTLMNGSDLNPCAFTTGYFNIGLPIPQADIIIKRPNHNGEYYIFHETFDNNLATLTTILYQTVVDMSLDSGRGAVTNIKNYQLYNNDTIHPGLLSAVRHANGRDWWLISKKYFSPYYLKWLIEPDTILGPFVQTNQPAFTGGLGFGQSCFSPDGDKYAIINNYKSFYVYDFDRCNGDLSYLYGSFLNDSSNWGNGCAFSPSGRFLYVATQFIIYQYDLWAGNIANSKTIVAVYDGFACPQPVGFTHFNMMRLGPDGKIYVCTDNGTYVLHVIENPDSLGTLCNVQQHSFYLSPAIGSCLSLPNIADYRLGALDSSSCDTIVSIKDEGSKKNKLFEIFPNPTTGWITLQFFSKLQCSYTISLSDVTGQSVYELKDKSLVGNNNKHINLSGFSKGIYFFQMRSESINQTIRIYIE